MNVECFHCKESVVFNPSDFYIVELKKMYTIKMKCPKCFVESFSCPKCFYSHNKQRNIIRCFEKHYKGFSKWSCFKCGEESENLYNHVIKHYLNNGELKRKRKTYQFDKKQITKSKKLAINSYSNTFSLSENQPNQTINSNNQSTYSEMIESGHISNSQGNSIQQSHQIIPHQSSFVINRNYNDSNTISNIYNSSFPDEPNINTDENNYNEQNSYLLPFLSDNDFDFKNEGTKRLINLYLNNKMSMNTIEEIINGMDEEIIFHNGKSNLSKSIYEFEIELEKIPIPTLKKIISS